MADVGATMHVPWRELSEAALQSVLEDFVTREGTDYGHETYTLERKVADVRAQLERGEAWLDFDPESETVTVRAAEA